ncbi:UNVERIFIED_CONTAM: hypothetical protein HDU68_001657, partial [Siphonaria sp. JEL0065]
ETYFCRGKKVRTLQETDNHKNANIGAHPFTSATALPICGAGVSDVAALAKALPPVFSENLPARRSLDLANNKLGSLKDIDPLKNCTALAFLTLELNPIAKLNDYRRQVFALVPSLVALGGTDVDGNEVEEDVDDEDEDGEEDEYEDEEEEDDDEGGEGAKVEDEADGQDGEGIEKTPQRNNVLTSRYFTDDEGDKEDGESEDEIITDNKRKRSDDDDDLDGDGEEPASKKYISDCFLELPCSLDSSFTHILSGKFCVN